MKASGWSLSEYDLCPNKKGNLNMEIGLQLGRWNVKMKAQTTMILADTLILDFWHPELRHFHGFNY